MTDDAKAACAIVVSPCECRRGPGAGGVALVRVDRRCQEERKLARARDPSGEKPVEDAAVAGECVLAVAPQARVEMAGVPDPGVVRLRHEGDRTAVEMRDLFRAVLVDHVAISGGQCVAVAEVDLLLTGPRFPFRALDRDARGLHPGSHLTKQRLVIRGRENVVVEDVRHRGRQVAVVLGVRLGVRLLQQVELELAAEHHVVARRARTLQLRGEHLPR